MFFCCSLVAVDLLSAVKVQIIEYLSQRELGGGVSVMIKVKLNNRGSYPGTQQIRNYVKRTI